MWEPGLSRVLVSTVFHSTFYRRRTCCDVHALCSQFNDLQVRSVQLDMVFRDPEHPTKGCIIDVESKSLRDTRGLLGPKVKISDVASFIEDNPHPRLWRLLAEFALRQLDLNIAERGFVRCQDYAGIEFVNKLRRLDDDSKQQAEVAVYFNQFEVAERIYHKMERSDLTKQMRVKLGDWFRVIKLLNSGGAAPDMKVMMQAWDRIGDYYADRLKWQQAATYYTRGTLSCLPVRCAWWEGRVSVCEVRGCGC